MDWFFLVGFVLMVIQTAYQFLVCGATTESVPFTEWAAWKLEWKACFRKKNIASDVGSFGDTLLSFSAAEMVLMQDWQCCAAVRSCKIPGLWKWATLCSRALSVVCSQFGSQQPLVLECAGSGRSCGGGSPVRLFHQAHWSFALPAVLPVPRVVVDDSFVDIPVNLVFLHGLGAQWGKFGFQTPAWFHSYPYDQQMELREYCFLEAKEIVFPKFLT